jgi:hypothetical protein
MYRRSAGGALGEEEDGDEDGLFLSDIESDAIPAASARKSPKAKGKAKAVDSPKRGRPRPVLQEEESSEGEAFDFNVSSSTESEPPSPRKRSRTRKIPPAATDACALSPRKRAKPDALAPPTDVDMPDPPSPKKRALKTAPALALATKRAGGKKPSPKKYHTVAQTNPVDSSDFFDSDSFGDLGSKIAPVEYLAHRPSDLGPVRARKLPLKPGEVDFFDNTNTQEDAISRAMSVLSVASPEAIILSD